MKRVNIIGHSYDSFLCEQLRRKEIYADYYSVDDLARFDYECHLLLLDLRENEQVSWAETAIRKLHKSTLILVLIDRQQLKIQSVQQLIGQHAWDYHTAPFEIDRLVRLMGHALGVIRIRLQCSDSHRHSPASKVKSEVIIKSPAMLELAKNVQRAAPTDIPILVRGESGTGKELIAKKIHNQSGRSFGPFVVVNCGSLTSGVVQSELFGHEKGSFTGAVNQHKGKISQANNGTLFLDEVGDLPLDQQVNLLRFLQEGTFDSVGGTTPQSSNVRIVAATHIDLEEAIELGNFRLDLFYRLNGITIELPPLRERKEDIIPLASHFCQKYAKEYSVGECKLSKEAYYAMMQHEWAGNVRELINRIRRAVLLCENSMIQIQDLELEETIVQPCFAQGLKTIKDEVEKHALVTAIQKHNGKMDIVANDLQISRATLYRLIDKHEIYAV
ncbi:sigma-54-dependent Fis family transcriptional regulator [Shewanella sairae]|uniref:Sigma-54-dependent Fis family transcriptional regulator n=1 Tax=Shewanella sairae TaxID=190310 RepID=A0ABQ4PPB9_9GAMM|nr:sigma-54 dependent transcriptional regulator [Shewanella sairae]MCL1132134.1 sigma-54 dependent transcriptional regulator [Shewanella sairae]GIU50540.1 sigma-54-dependent Fis family transcriptional regulator [Shewanella sairae]